MIARRPIQFMLAALLWLLPGKNTFSQNAFVEYQIDQYIEKGMKDWKVPALAVVIVKDGEVVKMQGYGYRSTTGKDPVDENTHFFIASNTKLFTGLALANLETQGKIKLDDPIRKYHPEYQLWNERDAEMVTIRDMLSHRIGLKGLQGDLTFWNTNLSSRQVMERMRLLKPSGIFRQDYGYCNSCFMTAGEVIPAVLGLSWAQYVQDSILNALGMSNSFAASNDIARLSQNLAVPYTTSYTGVLNTVPYDQWDNMGAAASIVSNVKDLAKWLQFQLDSGKVNGRQIMPFSALDKTRQINTITSSRKHAFLPMHIRGYGLGLYNADYAGRQIFWHTGGAAGMLSNVSFVPEEELGIAILSTNDNQSFFEALRYQILDSYLDVPYQDRSKYLLENFTKNEEKTLKEIEGWKSEANAFTRKIDLNPYTGTYSHPLYGKINIRQKQRELEISFPLNPGMTASLKPMADNKWLIEYSNIEYGIFSTNFKSENGKPVGFNLPVNPFVEGETYYFSKD